MHRNPESEKSQSTTPLSCLRKTKNTPHPPPQLGTHRLARVLSAERRLLVFSRAPDEEVETLGHGTPREQLYDLGLAVGLHRRVLHEALADLVGHALQLCVRQARQVLWRGDEHLARADRFGGLDRGQVVRGEHDVDGGEGRGGVRGYDRGRPLLAQDGRGAGVVAGVSAFFGVEAGARGFGVEVGTADELDAGDVVLLRGLLEVRGDAGGDAAQVALIGRVDQSAAVLLGIVFLLQRNGPLLEADVGNLFFGTGQQAHALCGGGITGFGDSGPHLRSGVLLILEEMECVTTETGPSDEVSMYIYEDRSNLLETDEVALAGHLNTLHHALAPDFNLGSRLCGGRLASSKNFQRVLNDDAVVTEH